MLNSYSPSEFSRSWQSPKCTKRMPDSVGKPHGHARNASIGRREVPMTCRWWDGTWPRLLAGNHADRKIRPPRGAPRNQSGSRIQKICELYQRPHQTDIQTSHRTEVRPALTPSPTSRSGLGSPRAKPGTWLRPTPVVCPSDKARPTRFDAPAPLARNLAGEISGPSDGSWKIASVQLLGGGEGGGGEGKRR